MNSNGIMKKYLYHCQQSKSGLENTIRISETPFLTNKKCLPSKLL